MNSLRRIAAAAAVLGLWAATAAAQGGGGVNALPFFLQPMDPGRAALGGSYSARSGDAAGIFVSPATGWNARSEMFVAHTEFEAGLRLEALALSVPMDFGGSFIFGAGYAHLGTLQNLDEVGSPVGADLAFGATVVKVGYGRAAGGRLAWGVGVEYLNQAIAGVSASAFAASVGALFRGEKLDISAAADHLGSRFHADGASLELPASLRGGLRLHPGRNLEILGELSRSGSDPAMAAGGLEWRPAEVVAVRAGYHREVSGLEPQSGISAGVGVGLGAWTADYGLAQEPGLRPVHRFGLRLALDRLGTQP